MDILSDIVPSQRETGSACREALRQQVREFFRQGAGEAREVVSLSEPVDIQDPLLWLVSQSPAEKSYWSSRRRVYQQACIGVADIQSSAAPIAPTSLTTTLRALDFLPGGRYVGGMRFDPSVASDDRWGSYGTYRFILPRVEVRKTPAGTRIRLHVLPGRDTEADVLSVLDQLCFHEEKQTFPASFPALSHRIDAPERSTWEATVQRVLKEIRSSELEKLVLARLATFEFSGSLDAMHVLYRLREATSRCFHYAILPREGPSFIGATPELLFSQRGRTIRSEAVAGTRPRSADKVEDEALGRALLESEKDQREHAFVRDRIEAALKPHTSRLSVQSTPTVMELANKRHLHSRIEGFLHPSVDKWDLLGALHPTPAVGGTPTDRAVKDIRAHEPVDRGWYAGPVGWVEDGDATFGVGIRCGLVQGKRLALYSGAGIVEGSDPASEWEEIEHKIRDFIDVLGLDSTQS